MRYAVGIISVGLLTVGIGVMPFWFTIVCDVCGLAKIAAEKDGW